MGEIPHGRYAREFREDAARLVLYDGQSEGEVSGRLSLPKFTLENWVRAAKAGKLGEVGKNRKPLSEVEVDLAMAKPELTVTRTVSTIDDLPQNCQRASPAVVSEKGVGSLRPKIAQWVEKTNACDLRAEKVLQICVTQPAMDPTKLSMPFTMATKAPKWELLVPQRNRKKINSMTMSPDKLLPQQVLIRNYYERGMMS